MNSPIWLFLRGFFWIGIYGVLEYFAGPPENAITVFVASVAFTGLIGLGIGCFADLISDLLRRGQRGGGSSAPLGFLVIFSFMIIVILIAAPISAVATGDPYSVYTYTRILIALLVLLFFTLLSF